jgi:predicted outer membrane protein
MAQYEIKYGKNAEMVQLAKSILAEQQSEIQQMDLLLKMPANIEKTDTLYQPAMSATMSIMMVHLPEQSRLTDTDQAFAAVMLPHHQAAIDMARVVLRFSKDQQVLAFARSLISNEQIEIDQMSAYLKSK